ncbi:hypothetical protein BKA65DRAFT_541050 [Rhexocercosporidium sp. MPI-PUGE-AT-0058]|nr:hypothetical protein BKA65DRAFT_541050 [Rhexocercosporidium sp. MPI-PUGE-AT-0058]
MAVPNDKLLDKQFLCQFVKCSKSNEETEPFQASRNSSVSAYTLDAILHDKDHTPPYVVVLPESHASPPRALHLLPIPLKISTHVIYLAANTLPGTIHLVDREGTIRAKHASSVDLKDIVLVPAPSADPEDPLN